MSEQTPTPDTVPYSMKTHAITRSCDVIVCDVCSATTSLNAATSGIPGVRNDAPSSGCTGACGTHEQTRRAGLQVCSM